MSDGMLNSTTKYNKSSGIQGIGDTVKAMDEWDMNQMCDPIVPPTSPKSNATQKYNKNS